MIASDPAISTGRPRYMTITSSETWATTEMSSAVVGSSMSTSVSSTDGNFTAWASRSRGRETGLRRRRAKGQPCVVASRRRQSDFECGFCPLKLLAFLCALFTFASVSASTSAWAEQSKIAVDQPPWLVFVPDDASEIGAGFENQLLPGSTAPPRNGLPDGGVASIEFGDIRAAWYESPTRRYRHAILGDDIEAGRLVVQSAEGESLALDLPESEVFEDITPRLADLDGDGLTEVVTIRSSTRLGASVAIYGLVDGKLALRAATPFIGRANRWLNIAGIADYLGKGGAQIAYVETPHIGGTLFLWSYEKGALTQRAALGGFSNHAIGSRIQALSVTRDLFGDARPELIVPDDRRRTLRVLSAVETGWRDCETVELPGRVAGMASGGVGEFPGGEEQAHFLRILLDSGMAVAARSSDPGAPTEPDPCP